jgi:enolase
MPKISDVTAREVIDSRGSPTIEVDITLESGHVGRAASPTSNYWGIYEALELRDINSARYNGRGVLEAVKKANKEIAPKIIGFEALDQKEIDHKLAEIDGTSNFSNLGSNTTIAVSIATAKAACKVSSVPLHRHLGGVVHSILPLPLMNIINGGTQTENLIDMQEFLIAPISAQTFTGAIRMASEVFDNLKQMLHEAGDNFTVDDKGAFVPYISQSREALDYIIRAIEKSGYKPGYDISIGIDCGGSELYEEDEYILRGEDKKLGSEKLFEYYRDLINEYPIFYLEDPFHYSDHGGWSKIQEEFGSKIFIAGDKLFATNKELIRSGALHHRANTTLIKPNQAGTLTKTFEVINFASKYHLSPIISHRAGETADSFISHLAVALNINMIKTGSIYRGERAAKYNELMRIEESLNHSEYIGRKIFKK